MTISNSVSHFFHREKQSSNSNQPAQRSFLSGLRALHLPFSRRSESTTSSLRSQASDNGQPENRFGSITNQSSKPSLSDKTDHFCVIGSGVTGLATAIEIAKSGSKVTIIAPEREPTAYPLLNMRQPDVQYLKDQGIPKRSFSDVSGISERDIPVENRFHDTGTSNIFHGKLIKGLKASAIKQGVQFEDREIDPGRLSEISTEFSGVFVATGASQTTKAFVEALQIQRAGTDFFENNGIENIEQTYISGVFEPSRFNKAGKGQFIGHRDPTTFGAQASIRQEHTFRTDAVWINLEVGPEASAQEARVSLDERAHELYGQDIETVSTTKPFTVKPRLNLGRKGDNKAPFIVNSDGKKVFVLNEGDANGSFGFRHSTGAANGLEHARLIGKAMLALGDRTSDQETAYEQLAHDIRASTVERLQAESAIMRQDRDELLAILDQPIPARAKHTSQLAALLHLQPAFGIEAARKRLENSELNSPLRINTINALADFANLRGTENISGHRKAAYELLQSVGFQ